MRDGNSEGSRGALLAYGFGGVCAVVLLALFADLLLSRPDGVLVRILAGLATASVGLVALGALAPTRARRSMLHGIAVLGNAFLALCGFR